MGTAGTRPRRGLSRWFMQGVTDHYTDAIRPRSINIRFTARGGRPHSACIVIPGRARQPTAGDFPGRSDDPLLDRAHPADGPGDPPSEAAPASGTTAPGLRWGWVIAAAIAAGLLAWAAGEATGDIFQLTPEELRSGDASLMVREGDAFLRGFRRVTTRTTAVYYAILGAALGTMLGLAGGLSRRSARGAIFGGAAGFIAGGALGALTSLALVPVFLRNYDSARPTLFLPAMVHGGIWAAIGAAGGLGLALGRGAGPSGLAGITMGGLLGAVLGTFVYEVVYAIAFPLSLSEKPVPGELSARLVAHLIVALSVGLGAAWTARPGVRRE